ncbi:MAG TPA: (d)CMP kinase [Pseudonocardia sp.]|uniref:(d)CMP kinase n=1 Tax=Pseudonocardia sp. TaxID=60912 RepID=UPI002C925A74|nr:(d)CMP kinase [Pseudonocardia sp.]HTF48541.1 (d)CMP kinase [Pseudonocardia sp.]
MGAERLRGVVALDGPSGTGKSTVARRLARQLAAGYLDTGAMYRAATLAVLRAGVDPADPEAVPVAVRAVVEVGTDPASPAVQLAGEDVAVEIRGEPVTSAVSAVSAHPEVRQRLVDQQRRIIASVLASGRQGIVVEGRDIGTVVAPEAPLKVYLTASAQVRARRRGNQDRRAGRGGDQASTLVAVQRRDELDSGRVTSPLRPAEDAVVLDTTELDVPGVLTALRRLATERGLVELAGGGPR